MGSAYGFSDERQLAPTAATVAGHDRGDRRHEVALVEAFREAARSGVSLLQFCKSRGVPESTMRHWLRRQESMGGPLGWVELVEGPEGLALLHQITTAATYVMTEVLGGGYRVVTLFLELSGLSQVVAAGHGTQYEVVKEMEEALVEFGDEERERLGSQMAPKSITLAEDETFHGSHPCLVAMEPVSNFILVEEYADDRRARTWDEAVMWALHGLPVDVFQSTSDEGTALLKHAEGLLDAHHSPDLFHPQQDISRATSLALRRQVTDAEGAAQEAQDRHEALMRKAQASDAQRQGPDRPRDDASRMHQAKEELEQATARLDEAIDRRRKVREAARAISTAYHPYDLETGEAHDAPTCQTELETQFATIHQVAAEAGLGSNARKRLRKAHRLVAQMVATIALIHDLIRAKVEALGLPEEAEKVVFECLVPASYLEEAARKAPSAERRSAIKDRAKHLRAPCEQADGPLGRLDPGERSTVDEVARECAQLFQRSSSCVEGRNGVLALRRHSLHRLSPRKLAALTVVHNYGTTRSDGTTAAGRFFGRQPRDLFAFLLDRLPPPARPAARRLTVN